MPLAQLAEPWPKMELVQLETEVRGGEITALKLTDLMCLRFLYLCQRSTCLSCGVHENYCNRIKMWNFIMKLKKEVTKHWFRQSSADIRRLTLCSFGARA